MMLVEVLVLVWDPCCWNASLPVGYGRKSKLGLQHCTQEDFSSDFLSWTEPLISCLLGLGDAITTEVKFLGQFSRPNLVKLLGYCWEDKDFLLVYEYMLKDSLENHLLKLEFVEGAEPLPWSTRIKIATRVSEGLDFLPIETGF